MTDPSYRPTASDIAAYQRDGAVVLRSVLDTPWVDLLNRGVDHNIANPGPNFSDFTARGTTGRCVKDYWAWRQIPEYQEFFRRAPLAGVVGELLQAREIRFLEDQFFEKAAGAATPSPWHQDQPYYAVLGTICVTWIPLDPVRREDCLELVAGSHAWGRLFTPANFQNEGGTYHVDETDSPLEPMIDIEGSPDQYRVLSWDLEPGDCIAFDPRMIHGNRGNSAPHRARRAAFRWVAEDAAYAPNLYPWVQIIDGHGLTDGEKLQGDTFPLVWTRERGMMTR